jgi:hypothetical protein
VGDPLISSNKTGTPRELNIGCHPIKWNSPKMERGVHSMKYHSPNMDMGAQPFINPQKMVDFPTKSCVFGLEMMGFFLQYDLGVMENVFHGVNGLLNLEK